MSSPKRKEMKFNKIYKCIIHIYNLYTTGKGGVGFKGDLIHQAKIKQW